MLEKKFTSELKGIFDYIKDELLKLYDCDKVTAEYFILSVLENENCAANKVLSKIMLHDSIEEFKIHYHDMLMRMSKPQGGKKEYSEIFDLCVKNAGILAARQKTDAINSAQLLFSIVVSDKQISKYFKDMGVTPSQIMTQLNEQTSDIIEEERQISSKASVSEKPVKHVRRAKKNAEKKDENIIIVAAAEQNPFSSSSGECEVLFPNLNKKAAKGQIEEILGNDNVYDEIFGTLAKKYKNNVILTGRSGVGKTETVRNIANLIVNGKAPRSFRNKILLEVDFNALFNGTGMRGAFEARLKAIMNDASRNGRYIFFIDSIGNALESRTNENDVENFINAVMKSKDVMLICTCTDNVYNKMFSNVPEWERYFEKIEIQEPSTEEAVKILKKHAEKLEIFHDVEYEEDVFETCVKLSRRYINERSLPDSAIDILDKAGAKMSLSCDEDDAIKTARERLDNIKEEKKNIPSNETERMDEMTKMEIDAQTAYDIAVKQYNLMKQEPVVTQDFIKQCISEKTNIPINTLTVDDKERLKNINTELKKVVIGQDDAVDEVCMAIKRQRTGISKPNKPVVFFFGGSTGVGKTFLCKSLAKQLWGDENEMIRLDMTEYSETASVTKLYGAPPSYVGYNDGGSLADRLKNKKHCILLLDEIEKACDKVYNVFLQMFDDGRITDSKGNTVDCKNIIVIMTSNIAARELMNSKPIGFTGASTQQKASIIDKELKKHFNPEFINRIDKVIYFNELTDESLRRIIELEIKNVGKRLEDIGYGLQEVTLMPRVIDTIYNNVKEKKNMGARPVIREIQNTIEDKITNLIIDNDIEKGHIFTENELI